MSRIPTAGLSSEAFEPVLMDPERLDLLISLGQLDTAAVRRLGYEGITSNSAFFSEARRDLPGLSRGLGMSEEDVKVAAVSARLLTLDGPGSVLIRQFTLRDQIMPLCEEHPGMLDGLMVEPDAEIIEFFRYTAYVGSTGREPGESSAASTSGKRTQPWVWMLGSVALVGIGQLIQDWRQLFPSGSMETPTAPVVSAFLRANALLRIETILIAGLFGVLMFWIVGQIVAFVTTRLLDWFERRSLSPVDYTILLDAMSTLSPRESRFYARIQDNFVGAYIVTILALAGLTFIVDFRPAASWMGYPAAAIIAAGLAALFLAQRAAFRRLRERHGVHWGALTDIRFARMQLARYAVVCVVSIPLAFGCLALFYQLTSVTAAGLLTERHNAHLATAALALNAITPAAEEAAQWAAEKAELMSRLVNATQAHVNSAARFEVLGRDVFPALARAVFAGMLGCGLAFIIAQYWYSMRARGIVAAVIWVALLVLSDRLPAAVAQNFLGLPAGTIQGVIGVLGIAAVIGILGELWMPGSEPIGSRFCPNPTCEVAFQPTYSAEDRVCSRCASPLRDGAGDVAPAPL
jgi:hypothetical protein